MSIPFKLHTGMSVSFFSHVSDVEISLITENVSLHSHLGLRFLFKDLENLSPMLIPTNSASFFCFSVVGNVSASRIFC